MDTFGTDMETLIAETREKVGTGKLFAFVPAPVRAGVALGYATLGEAGYTVANYGFFKDYSVASQFTEQLNGKLGLNQATAIAIIADTMHRQELARDERLGVRSIKLTLEELKYLREAMDDMYENKDELGYRLDDAIEELENEAAEKASLKP